MLLIILGSLAAYVIIRRPGQDQQDPARLFLIAIILPAQLGLVPLYIGLRSLGLVGTQIGMIILYTGMLMPLSVFLYAGFFRTLPRDYEEAAPIDGATPFATFRSRLPADGPGHRHRRDPHRAHRLERLLHLADLPRRLRAVPSRSSCTTTSARWSPSGT